MGPKNSPRSNGEENPEKVQNRELDWKAKSQFMYEAERHEPPDQKKRSRKRKNLMGGKRRKRVERAKSRGAERDEETKRQKGVEGEEERCGGNLKERSWKAMQESSSFWANLGGLTIVKDRWGEKGSGNKISGVKKGAVKCKKLARALEGSARGQLRRKKVL